MTTSEPVGTRLGEPASRSPAQRATVRARRADLLDRLCDLFLAEGFAHFTLGDLAARLHCSKSTLYTLADSKEQLAVRVVGHYFKRATDHVEQRGVHGIDDVAERVRAYLDAASEALRPASRQFIDDVAAQSATRETYEANARAAADRLCGFIDEGVARGAFRPVRAAFVAEVIGRTVSGIQRGEVGANTGLTDAEAFAELAQFLLGGLSVEPGHSAGPTEEQ
jgi:AcrR family transcriptional regulator